MKKIPTSEIRGNPSTIIAPKGTVVVDADNRTIAIHDGSTPGGVSIGGTGGSTPLVNNLLSTSTTSALTAAQGKVLKDTADALATTVAGKQNTLVSGTSIKTVNGVSVLGSGDLVVGGAGITDGDKGDIIVSSSGTVWAFDSSVVISAGRSLIGAANTATQQSILGLGAYQQKLGGASAFTTRALTSVDDGQNLIVSTAQTATINTGLGSFGCTFLGPGAISFTAGAGVTFVDWRTAGATFPTCSLVLIGSESYAAVGGKV